MAGISQQEYCWLVFRAVRCRQPSSDKLEQVSAYSVILILLSQHQAVSGAGQKFFFVEVRARHPITLILEQVALNRFFFGAVRLATLSDASLASRRPLKRSVLARAASRSAVYSDMALAPSVARSSFLNCASAHFRSLVSSVNVRSY
jgi:hypothetical protein